MNTIKEIIDDYAKPYLERIFADSPNDVIHSAAHLITMLELLPSEVSEVVLDYCKKNGFDVNIGHDLNGLYNEDRCFLPRIKGLQKFAS